MIGCGLRPLKGRKRVFLPFPRDAILTSVQPRMQVDGGPIMGSLCDDE